MSVGSNSDSGFHTHTRTSSGIEGRGTSLVEGNPWLPFCASRLSALDDPKVPLIEVRDKFKQEIGWIEEAMSVIKSRLNMLCPIARLSPEVLAHVFRHLADIYWPSIITEYPSKVTFISLGWINVSHVCQSWRNAALNYPDLWGRGNICFPPKWTNERLRRSKETLFDVVLYDGKIPPAVIANAHRIRKISIVGHSVHANTSLLALLTSSAPSLETFTCEISPKNPGNHLKLPDIIFACNAPRLTHLLLENTTLTFHPCVFDNLVHLHLKYRDSATDDVDDLPLNRKQLRELLFRIPKLETLVLEGKIHEPSEDIEFQSDVGEYQPEPASSSSVPLPRLKKLALDGDPWSSLWLAEQLSIPATASFWMHCRMDTAVEDQAAVYDALIPFMIRHLMGQEHSKSTQMLRVMCGSRGWQLTTVLAGWTDTLHDHVGTPQYWIDKDLRYFPEDIDTVPAPIDFAFSSDMATVIPVVHVLRPVLANICTSNIIDLHVCGTASQMDCLEWLRLFASFTALEHLSIYGMVAFNLMQALGLDLTINIQPPSIHGDRDTMSPGPQVLFPALRSLGFFRVDFTCFISAADALLSDITTTALTERREMNRELEEIILDGCRFRMRWVDRLRKVGFRCTTRSAGLEHWYEHESDEIFPLYDE